MKPRHICNRVNYIYWLLARIYAFLANLLKLKLYQPTHFKLDRKFVHIEVVDVIAQFLNAPCNLDLVAHTRPIQVASDLVTKPALKWKKLTAPEIFIHCILLVDLPQSQPDWNISTIGIYGRLTRVYNIGNPLQGKLEIQNLSTKINTIL